MANFKELKRLQNKNNISFTKTVKLFSSLKENEALETEKRCPKCKRITILRRIEAYEVKVCQACFDAWYGHESIFDNGSKLKELGWMADVSKLIP